MSVYISRIIVYVIFIVVFVISQTACIKIYRQDLRQGNYVTQEKFNKLKVGLSKEEVQKIMGSPALVPVIDVNRWDYYYSFMSGDRKTVEKKALSLYFANNKLQSYDGDWRSAYLPHNTK